MGKNPEPLNPAPSPMSDEIKLAAGVFLGALLLTVGLLEGLWYWQRRKNPPRDTNDEEAHPDY